MTEPPAESRRTGPDQGPDPIVDIARQIAAALLPLADEPALQRHTLIAVARALREALAREHTQPECGPSPPHHLRLARRIARAIGTTALPDGPAAVVADLRFFARLTLGECAELLDCPRDMLARVWRASRHALVASVRAAGIARTDVLPPSESS